MPRTAKRRRRSDPAERSGIASRLLLIRSLDDLKDRLGKVVLLVLVIRFFQQALALDLSSPLELLYLGGGILLVGAALYLTSRSHASPLPPPAPPGSTTGRDERHD